jgi:hypothetical protein
MQPQIPFWFGEQYPYNETWECVQGDAFAAYIEMFCDCPTPVNITGWQFMFQVKESLDPDDPNLLGAVLWTAKGGECGITALIVVPAVTALIPDGRYAFDLKCRSPSQLVGTIRRGELNVLPTTSLELSLNQEVPPVGGGYPALPPQGSYPGLAALRQPAQTYIFPGWRQGYG